MNFKKILTTIVAGLSLFAVAGTSSAAITSDINIYGASAQFIMWRDNAAAFMTSEGCSSVQSAQVYVSGAPDKKNAITKGVCGGNTYYVRTSAEASYGGPCAMNNNYINVPPYGPAGNPNCDAACSGDATKRSMADEGTCNWTTGQCTGKKCVTVTAGASDVPVECFTQESHGYSKGPVSRTTYLNRNFKTSPLAWSGDPACSPLVVPFAFFVNNTVTKNASTITNITRDNVELIFSGQVYDWADLVDVDGVAYDSKNAVACLRHAGSGTHASIDAYLNSDLSATESTSVPIKYFNNGSSDQMVCVNGNGGSWLGTGAIGYADADQSLTDYSITTRLSLNGVAANATNIALGAYNFIGNQQLYGITEDHPLCVYANDPDHISGNYWAAQCEMIYTRTNGCEAFGIQYKGNTCP